MDLEEIKNFHNQFHFYYGIERKKKTKQNYILILSGLGGEGRKRGEEKERLGRMKEAERPYPGFQCRDRGIEYGYQ